VANKFDSKLGLFVIKVREDKPEDFTFLIKWKNKLNIGDTNMFILRSSGGDADQNNYSDNMNYSGQLKELVVSYKTVLLNTYNVICMDLSIENNSASEKVKDKLECQSTN
jgi:hypothetical protein